MKFKLRCSFLDKHEDARVGNNEAVWFNVTNRIDIDRKLVDILVVRKKI